MQDHCIFHLCKSHNMLIMMFSEIDHVHLGPWNLRVMVGHSLTFEKRFLNPGKQPAISKGRGEKAICLSTFRMIFIIYSAKEWHGFGKQGKKLLLTEQKYSFPEKGQGLPHPTPPLLAPLELVESIKPAAFWWPVRHSNHWATKT